VINWHIKGPLALFVLVSFFLATCAR